MPRQQCSFVTINQITLNVLLCDQITGVSYDSLALKNVNTTKYQTYNAI